MVFNEVQLKDICSIIKRGISPKYADFGVPVINQRCIRENRIDWNIARFHNLEKKNIPIDRYLKRFDVCVNSTGVGTLGRLAQLKENVSKSTVDSHVTIIRCNSNDVDKLYFGWAVKYLEPTITDMGEGSTGQTELSRHRVGDLKIPLPPLAEQKRIAHLLGSLDDKIELNRKMNETLEEMAQAIFKSWFIDFDGVPTEDLVDSELGLIPKGWEVKTLNAIIDYAIGGQWGKAKPDEKHTELVHCVRGTDIPDITLGKLGKPAPRYLKSSTLKKRKLQNGDIVFEISGGSPTQSTGRTLLITTERTRRWKEPMICSNFCRLIRPKSIEVGVYIYHLLDYRYRRGDYFNLENGTTGIKNFPFTYFAENEPFLSPPKEILCSFQRTINTILTKIDHNGGQSQTLSELRDTLLPKLISGEIRIPEAEEQVAQQLPLFQNQTT